MARLIVFAALAVLIAGLAVVLSRARPPEARAWGYRLRGDEVRFRLRARHWRTAVYLATGDTVPLRDLRVRRASVVGPFNDWTPGAWPMERDEGEFVLRRSVGDLGDADSVRFAFIVNDRFWLEPRPETPNRVPGPGGRHALVLAAPGAASRRDADPDRRSD
jgi:hypothetical protein